MVEITNFEFRPDTLTVAVGDTVVWLNRDVVPHTASAQDRLWDSGSIGAGASWTYVVSTAVETVYICTLHPSMKGWVAVR